MLIEYPHPHDIEPVVALADETGFFSPIEVGTVREMLDEYFESHGQEDDYIFLVYREHAGAAPIGFAAYGHVPLTEGSYDLYWIAVHPGHQNKRIGRALLQAVEAQVAERGGRALYAETSDTDQYTPTRKFYERAGYETAAHLPEFYKPGDGKVVYRKWLHH